MRFSLFCFFLFIAPSVFAQDSTHRSLQITPDALNFLVMGDFGRDGEAGQKETAAQMGMAAKKLDADFIIATGDNFYPSGVASVWDPAWKKSFEDVYTAASLQTDWYVVPGNHDYKGSVAAEVAYTKISRRWNMPARYYYKKIAINEDTTNQVLLIFIDTSPLVTQYYSSADHRDSVKTQDTTAQKRWIEGVLRSNNSPNIKWKIVVGHHPAYTGGKRLNSIDTKQINASLKPLFDKYGVDLYLCGHEHNLQYIKPAGKTHYFVSGAGSELTPVILYPEIGKFAQSTNGFMCFSLTPKQCNVQVSNAAGGVVYSAQLTN